jgi:hypothetical protein
MISPRCLNMMDLRNGITVKNSFLYFNEIDEKRKGPHLEKTGNFL